MRVEHNLVMRLTRRNLLRTFGTTALGASVPRWLWGCSGEDGAAFAPRIDTTPFDAGSSDAGSPRFDLPGLPTENGLWQLVNQMNDLGPRYTGNRAHVHYVELLAAGLASLGLDVRRDTKTFFRWEAKKYGLSLAGAGGSTDPDLPVTSYYPYSGETPVEGITAGLYYAGARGKIDYSGAAGKIVIIDMPIQEVSLASMFHVAAAYPDSELNSFPETALTATSQAVQVPSLKAALDAGAVGAILVWTNVSDAAARDQYIPFARPHQGLPALWVGEAIGDRLKSFAHHNAKVTLTLMAETDANATTDTLWAELPGQSADEVIIVNSNTDGPNAVEENGGIAVLALATALSQLPLSERRRTVVFALTSGQFAWGPGSIVSFIEDHGDIVQKAVAAVTIEHCGCLEWSDDQNGEYRATGNFEPGITMTSMKPEVTVFQDAMQGTQNDRMFAIDSTSPYFGEGAPLFLAQVPTLSYIPLPSYLCSGPANGHIDKLSPARFAQEVLAFGRAIRIIDAMPATVLRGQTPPTPTR